MSANRSTYTFDEEVQLELIYKELIKLNTNLSNTLLITELPEYANDAAADADVTLLFGQLYTVTGDRTVYKKS